MIQFTTAVWAAILPQSTAAGRANALAGLGIDTIEFLDAAAAVIRTVTTGAWTVSGANAVPGAYTDAGTGGGTPFVAVFKAGATEIMRMTCGTWAGADYRLLANIVAGVPIRRGPFAVLFLPPPEPGTSQPSVVTAPTISGVAKVGQTLTATPGVYAGNPVPTITRQWYSGATAIPGATGLFVTLTDDELGGILTFEELPSNSVGSITVTSNALGPVVAADLNADAIPATIQINQGGTFDLTPYVVGGVPPYTAAVAAGYSLPTGVTQTGPMELSAAIDAPLTNEPLPTVKFDIDDSAPSVTLPTFGVLSHVGGADLPFAAAHVFKQGDVPSGSFVDSDLTDWQCTPVTRWPDGSLKHAIIAGRATCSVQVLRAAQLSVAGTDRAGTALTPADLAAALPAVTVQGGSQVITLNDLVATPFKTVLTGPVMSQWIFRAPVPGSNHLVVLFELRLYKGGRVELFPPKVENGYLFTAGPTNDVRTWTLTIGGVVAFTASIDIKHHAHAYLLDNSASSFKHFSYWIGGDPQIEPVHDVAYLKATKAVPNYGWTTQESTLAGLTQTYTPMWRGNVPAMMGTAGYQQHIGVLPNWQAAYLSSNADARAYRSVLANGHAAGSWSIHYRDEVTNEPPLYTDWPNASIDWGGTPSIPGGTGGEVGTHDYGHQPSMAYLPWLLTGRWYFLDEMLFWNFRNYLAQSYVTREYANGLFLNEQIRSRGWNLRTLAQLLSALPDGNGAVAQHPAFASIKAAWENNVAAYEGLYVTGTRGSGAWQNALGCLGLYTGASPPTSPYGTEGTHWWDAPWMQDTLILAFGHAWDLDVPQSVGAKASHLAVRNHGYKHAVGVAGPGSAGTFNWRHFGSYSMPYAQDSVALPPESWLADWGAVYAVYQQYANSGWTALPDPDPNDPTGAIYYGANQISAGAWATTSGVAFHYASLAMAKEHGAAGADEAWSRITGSQSWLLAPADFRATPVWSIYPRNA